MTRAEIQAVFEKNLAKVLRYKKIVPVDARLAVPGERIITVIDGIEETSNTAKADQVVVMNITTNSREMYILDRSNFDKRYLATELLNSKWQTFQPQGETDAFEWTGGHVQFDAPWGEEMLMVEGDYLCRVPDTEDDIYRIERGSFSSYALK